MKSFSSRMVTDPEFVRRAVDVYVNRSIVYIEAMLDAGCDAVMTTDDYSDNRGRSWAGAVFANLCCPGWCARCKPPMDRASISSSTPMATSGASSIPSLTPQVDGWPRHPTLYRHGFAFAQRALIGASFASLEGVNCETLVEGTPEMRAPRCDMPSNTCAGRRPGGDDGNVLQPGTRRGELSSSAPGCARLWRPIRSASARLPPSIPQRKRASASVGNPIRPGHEPMLGRLGIAMRKLSTFMDPFRAQWRAGCL